MICRALRLKLGHSIVIAIRTLGDIPGVELLLMIIFSALTVPISPVLVPLEIGIVALEIDTFPPHMRVIMGGIPETTVIKTIEEATTVIMNEITIMKKALIMSLVQVDQSIIDVRSHVRLPPQGIDK